MTTKIDSTQVTHAGQALDTFLANLFSTVATYSTTWDPPSLATNTYTTQSFTVTGALAGQIALCSFTNMTADATLQASVTAPNTVSVLLRNNSAGTLNLSAGTLRIILI